jgi:hypothetical protein
MSVRCKKKLEVRDDEGEKRQASCQLVTQHRGLHRYSSVKQRVSVTWSDGGTFAIETGVPFWKAPEPEYQDMTIRRREWASQHAALVDQLRDKHGLGGLRGEERWLFWARSRDT